MKTSKYIIQIPLKGFVILYNSFTDKFIGVSHEVATTLKDTEHGAERVKDKSEKQFQKLQTLGFIIDDDADELQAIRDAYHKAKYSDRRLYFMVYPTQDCNLKCWYCYESHKKGTRMSPQVVKSIEKLVAQRLAENSFDSLQLGFFGGEPLLDFKNIAYPLAKSVKQMCEERVKTFSTFFVTNASLIDEETASKLSEINPYLQITIDGDKEKHDKVRIWKRDGRGTYDKIIQAVQLLTQCVASTADTDDPVVTLRINYDNHTLEGLSALLNDLADVDKKKVRIHFERVWQTRSMVNDVQRRLLADTFVRFIRAGFTLTHGIFRRKQISCPTDSEQFFIVNHDGTVHKCNGRTLDKSTQEGILTSQGGIDWDMEKRDKRLGLQTFENASCLVCKLLPLCMGPCSQKVLETGGFSADICSRHSMDIPIEDYLKYEFEMRYYLEQLEEKEKTA